METKSNNDPRASLAQMILQVAVRDVEPGGKASDDCKTIRDSVNQFDPSQVVATVNLSVVLGEGGFTVVGGVAGPIMAARALLMLLDAHVDGESPNPKRGDEEDFAEAMMGAIMANLFRAGGSTSDQPRDQETKQAESKDPKQSEADAHLAETFGEIKSPSVASAESPQS